MCCSSFVFLLSVPLLPVGLLALYYLPSFLTCDVAKATCVLLKAASGYPNRLGGVHVHLPRVAPLSQRNRRTSALLAPNMRSTALQKDSSSQATKEIAVLTARLLKECWH